MFVVMVKQHVGFFLGLLRVLRGERGKSWVREININ